MPGVERRVIYEVQDLLDLLAEEELILLLDEHALELVRLHENR